MQPLDTYCSGIVKQQVSIQNSYVNLLLQLTVSQELLLLFVWHCSPMQYSRPAPEGQVVGEGDGTARVPKGAKRCQKERWKAHKNGHASLTRGRITGPTLGAVWHLRPGRKAMFTFCPTL